MNKFPHKFVLDNDSPPPTTESVLILLSLDRDSWSEEIDHEAETVTLYFQHEDDYQKFSDHVKWLRNMQ
jgi:hypothetical protein